jgi:hypothetical protein
VFDAMLAVGVAVEPVVYADAVVDDVRAQLLGVSGVLVWVDPISGGEDRTVLDALLWEIAERGIWVSAHPDTIMKMGTKEVLYRTRSLGWGADTHLYSSAQEFRSGFPISVSAGRPRVLKQNRGNGGIGVWKVTPLDADARLVRVQHAEPRDDTTEDVPLPEFLDRCEPLLVGEGRLVDQPFAERLQEGMIRAYLVEREVVGFARQQPTDPSVDARAPDPGRVLGLPSAKTMYNATAPEFQNLRDHLEHEWVSGLCALADMSDADLPVLWDADFLYGPRTGQGDTYMLCEINVSSVSPFPHGAPARLASAVARRLDHP